MLAYLYAVSAGDMDAVRSALLYGSLIGGAIVVAGLLWEAGKFDAKAIVVIFGICLESFCTWRLFVVDELAFQQLVGQRRLTGEQKDRLALVTEKFPALNFQTATVFENEPWSFVTQVGIFLESHGWHWLPCGGPNNGGQSLPPVLGKPTSCWFPAVRGVEINGPNVEILKALAGALKEPNVVGMSDVRPRANPTVFPTIVIAAGTKL